MHHKNVVVEKPRGTNGMRWNYYGDCPEADQKVGRSSWFFSKMKHYTHELVWDGNSHEPQVISRHKSLNAAERAMRRRNPHLYSRRWAEQHGMQDTGTFDRISEIE